MTTLMNTLENLIVQNPIRWTIQKHWELPTLIKQGLQLTNKNILELGSGTANLAHHITKKHNPQHYTATDLDPKNIKKALKHPHPKITIQQADATNLPYQNNTYDTTLTFGLLHHLPNWQQAIKEITRTLKPNGQYALTDFTHKALKHPINKLFNHPQNTTPTPQQLIQTLQQNNMTITNHKTYLNNNIIILTATKNN